MRSPIYFPFTLILLLVSSIVFLSVVMIQSPPLEGDEIGHAAHPCPKWYAFSFGPDPIIPPRDLIPLHPCFALRNNCGSITPEPGTVWIADGGYNSQDGTIFFADVSSSFVYSVFQFDPVTCTIVPGS